MKRLFSVLVVSLSFVAAFAQSDSYFSTNGVAIKGYDPVAYFTGGKAVPGNGQWSYTWKGSVWHFSSEANLVRFKSDPEKFAPQYGGFCAYGCSEKHKSPTDPNAWTIVNNKLYLNYSLKVKELWVKDSLHRIESANAFWSTLKP